MNRPSLVGLLGANWRKDRTNVAAHPSWPMGAPQLTTHSDAEMHNRQWYTRARRWVPYGAPLAAGTLLLLLAQVLVSNGIGGTQKPHTVGSVATLLALYAVGGVIWGLSLWLAPTVRLWGALLCGGIMLYLVAFAGVLFGQVGAGVALVVLAMATLMYIRSHALRVEEGTLTVTQVRGAYARTLLHGRHLLMPYERPTTPFDCAERVYTAEHVNVAFLTAAGTHHQASASLRVTYRVNPAYGHTLLALHDNWEDTFQDKIVHTFEETLREFSADLQATKRAPTKGMLANRTLTLLRSEGPDFGVDIVRVRIRNAQLDNDETGPVQPVPAAANAGSGVYGSFGSQPGYASMPHGLGLHSASLPPIYVYAPPLGVTPAYPAMAAYANGADLLNGTAAAAPYYAPFSAPLDLQEPHYNAFSADTLKESYEAIRENRISAPETIRAVAAAFANVARDPHGQADFPYDAQAAAHILLEHAATLERQTLQPA